MKSFALVNIILISFLIAVVLSQEGAQKNRVLVLLDSLAIKDTHSLFFQDLKKNGYNLDFKLFNYDTFKIQEFGEYQYDQIILFCTSVTEAKALKSEKILEFFDSGRNLLIAADVDTSKYFRLLVNQLGAELDVYGSKVFDEVRAVDGSDNGLFSTDNQINQDAIVPQLPNGVLYRGIGMSVTPYENTEIVAFLRGTEYTYSKFFDSSSEDDILSTGSNVVLVAGLQARNNARAVVTGSLDMFSNELFSKSNGTNQQYAAHLVKWNFGQSGVLRVEAVRHHHLGQRGQPSEYKIMDNIVYDIDITTWDATQKKWIPYVAKDIYLEFVMLDPYFRIPLQNIKGTATYRAEFKIPDKHGVFQFKVTYKKPGFSFLESSTKIPVRPFNHNEYERFLPEAFPYYITVFGTLVGFYVFVVFFLFDSSREDVKGAKKE